MTTGHTQIWKLPYSEVLPFLLDGYKIGLETGNFEMAGTCISVYAGLAYNATAKKNLTELESEIEEYLKALKRMNLQTPYNHISIDMQAIQSFTGKSQNPSRLKGEYYGIDRMIPVHQEANDRYAIAYACNHAQMLCYHFGDYENAIWCCRESGCT